MTAHLRSGRPGNARPITLIFAVPIALLCAACDIGLTAASAGTPPTTNLGDATSSHDAAAGVGSGTSRTALAPSLDAGVSLGASALQLGSPLCNVSATSVCNPDDAGCSAACAEQVLGEAGAAAATASGTCDPERALACHVTAVRGDADTPSVVPRCSEPHGFPHPGTAEAPCDSSATCAIGYECVVNDAAGDAGKRGVCRHYCCNNVCADAADFCDIETTADGEVAVPVCVASQSNGAYGSCELLGDSCPYGLSCQIVDQSTSLVACVKPGSATAGESCETEKCAKGFSCIGAFPNRQCAQLCNVDEPGNCLSGTCSQNTALSSNDSAVGVCAE